MKWNESDMLRYLEDMIDASQLVKDNPGYEDYWLDFIGKQAIFNEVKGRYKDD